MTTAGWSLPQQEGVHGIHRHELFGHPDRDGGRLGLPRGPSCELVEAWIVNGIHRFGVLVVRDAVIGIMGE